MKPRLAIHDTTIHVETFTSPWIEHPFTEIQNKYSIYFTFCKYNLCYNMRRGRPKGARRKDVFILLLYIIKWLYAWILPMGGIVLALILLLCYMFRKHSPGR